VDLSFADNRISKLAIDGGPATGVWCLSASGKETYFMSKEVLVPIAEGTEELEAVTIVDVLRRAGAQVTVASVGGLQVTASRGVHLVADTLISDCSGKRFDLIVLPGGMPGAQNLCDSSLLGVLLKRQDDEGRLFGAICASPAVVLEHHGLLEGKKATSYPSFMDQLKSAKATPSRVVVDGQCVTSQGPGTALEFALTLVELLFGKEKAKEIAEAMVVSKAPDGIV
jgi:4-methyl-5(b-hydroxyethyl)-thiazole monophosphate biosynthesis